ncbi:MAG: hypothetical protein IT374_09165 [Polyangiaceae bacterium]|nr:hypothetical protein [Polyangiaceae bacterium]
MTEIGLVWNPRAGSNRRDPDGAKRLQRQLGDRGIVAAPTSLAELSRVAEDFRKRDIRVLGIAGGDGTNHVTMTGFREVYGDAPLPTLAFLRGGTMNTVADALGVSRGRPEGLLDKLVVRCLAPDLPTQARPTLDIEGKLGFLWGVGVLPAFLQAYYDTGAPSPWTAVKTLSRAVGSALVGGALAKQMTQPIEVALTVDGEALPSRRYMAVAAGTVADLGLGFRPFHLAPSLEDRFHLLSIHASAPQLVAELPRIRRGQPMREGRSTDRGARVAVVRVPGDSMSMMIDGDMFRVPRGEITLRVGPTVRVVDL